GAWAVVLTIVPESQVPVFIDQSESFTEDRILRQAQANAKSASRAPGGVRVGAVREGNLVDVNAERALGHIEAGLQLLCAIERLHFTQCQEFGLFTNSASFHAQATRQLEVTQQAVSSRLQAGY